MEGIMVESFFGQIIPKPILIKLVIILVSNQLKKREWAR